MFGAAHGGGASIELSTMASGIGLSGRESSGEVASPPIGSVIPSSFEQPAGNTATDANMAHRPRTQGHRSRPGHRGDAGMAAITPGLLTDSHAERT
jgi:hypothetical protein